MTKQHFIRLTIILLLIGLSFSLPSSAIATSVDRVALCNLEGYAGETIEAKITLQGNETQERSGFWTVYYKQMDGDDERMDITSWITIEPEEYTIIEDQSITFRISIKVPPGAAAGLWGATSEEACLSGHSGERRTYIIYKDTITGGNVYSGLLIPISVRVLEKVSPEASPADQIPLPSVDQGQQEPDFLNANLLIIILGGIILILLIVILTMWCARRRQ